MFCCDKQKKNIYIYISWYVRIDKKRITFQNLWNVFINLKVISSKKVLQYLLLKILEINIILIIVIFNYQYLINNN